MPRKETALTRLDGAELEHDDDDPDHDEEAACLLCELRDNDDEDPLVDRLARAMAYGALVLAPAGGGVSTCDDCHDAIAGEMDDLRKELRKMRRASR